MEKHNPNITPEGDFTLTYFPYRPDAKPHTALEEAIQYLYDCWEYEEELQPQSPMTKERLSFYINKVILPDAEAGNQDAIHWMFFAYQHGLGVEQDYGKAVEYLTLLADRGYPDMQCELGLCYQNVDWPCPDEEECERRMREATKWLQKAAEQGNQDAKEALMFDGRDREPFLDVDQNGFLPYPYGDSDGDAPF